MTIDKQSKTIYGKNGWAHYETIDSGQLKVFGSVAGGISDAEYHEAKKQLAK